MRRGLIPLLERDGRHGLVPLEEVEKRRGFSLLQELEDDTWAWFLVERERKHGYDPVWSPRGHNGTCRLGPFMSARKGVVFEHSWGWGDLWVCPPLLVGGKT